MNLDFGILWIEDSFSNEEKMSIERRILDAGFLPRIDDIPNSKGIDTIAQEHRLYHKYDLILLDYRLHDERGNEIAPRIRELFPSVNIIFYSGTKTEDELRKLIAEKAVEGVYCAKRDDRRFIERTGELIQHTARSLDRLSGMRGLAMKIVAECDDLMNSIILMLHNANAICEQELESLDRDVINFIKETESLYTSASSDGIEGRLKTRAIDSAKRFKHFRRLTKILASKPTLFGLDVGKLERLRELRGQNSQYINSVLMKRNALGHAKETQGQNGWVLEGDSGIDIREFPELRRTFAEYISSFREILEIVRSRNCN